MILCSCTRLNTSRVRATLKYHCQNDPYRLVTPGRLFSMTGEKMQCGRCAGLINEVITKEMQRLQEVLPDNPTQTPQSGKD